MKIGSYIIAVVGFVVWRLLWKQGVFSALTVPHRTEITGKADDLWQTWLQHGIISFTTDQERMLIFQGIAYNLGNFTIVTSLHSLIRYKRGGNLPVLCSALISLTTYLHTDFCTWLLASILPKLQWSITSEDIETASRIIARKDIRLSTANKVLSNCTIQQTIHDVSHIWQWVHILFVPYCPSQQKIAEPLRYELLHYHTFQARILLFNHAPYFIHCYVWYSKSGRDRRRVHERVDG